MTGKENHFEAAEMTAARTNENRAKTPPEIPLGPILNDLVTFADELNTRNISEAAANQSYRTILLRWLRLTFILSLFLTAILLVFIYLFYCAFAKLALTAHDEIKLVASQAAMLEEQRTIADGVLAAMRAQLNEQIAADRPALIPNGIVPIKLGTFPQSWTQVETKNGPPETVAVGWHNFGNSIATDFVQMGRLMLGKAGDPSPVNPECEELHRPGKQDKRIALAPDNTMFSVWTIASRIDLKNTINGSILYAVGCAYYAGLDKRFFFSDVCFFWTPNKQPEFQPCGEPNRNYMH